MLTLICLFLKHYNQVRNQVVVYYLLTGAYPSLNIIELMVPFLFIYLMRISKLQICKCSQTYFASGEKNYDFFLRYSAIR